MFHYVYEIRLGPLFYIGCRTCRTEPQKDTKYMGSGMWCRYSFHAMSRERVKTILSVWSTRKRAADEEARLITGNRGKFGCMNLRTPSRYKTEAAVS